KFFSAVVAENFSEDLFAAAVAVGPRSVKEIAAEIDGALQRVKRFGVVGAGPAGESPHAITNFTHVPSGAAKLAIVHGVLSWIGAHIIRKAGVGTGAVDEHSQDSSRCIGAMGKRWLCHRAPTPMFVVSVAFKELKYCASSLFATHRRGHRSVASKELRL